ncbi:MAG: nuclear transport factor 2 family protein [Kofleriaceae bacterium]
MTNTEVAKQLLVAWTTGDFATVDAVIAESIDFVGPLGHTTGAAAYAKGIREFAALIDRAEIEVAFGDGENVCIIYDLVTKAGAKAPTAGHYRIVDGKVAMVRAYFNPALLKL